MNSAEVSHKGLGMDPIASARQWLNMPGATPEKIREELVAQVVAGLRARNPQPPALGFLETHFQKFPETLFCLGLQAWSRDYKAHGYVYFRHLQRVHPQSPYAALTQTMLPDWQRELKNEGDLSELLNFEKLLVKISRADAGWGSLVEPAAAGSSVIQRRKLAWACFENGSLELALSVARGGREAQNLSLLHAAGFFNLLLGRQGQAQDIGRQILAGLTDEHSYLAMEFFASLGDDTAVLDIYSSCGEGAGQLHLAAVAHARKGDWAQAKLLWTAALELDPLLKVAAANLENARLAERDRSSAWPFQFSHWSRSGRLTAALIPILLDRGDPASVEQALVEAVRAPDAYGLPLRDFASGTRGTAALRSLSARLLETAPPLFSPVTEGILDAMSGVQKPPRARVRS